jgi:hypothetical protein
VVSQVWEAVIGLALGQLLKGMNSGSNRENPGAYGAGALNIEWGIPYD